MSEARRSYGEGSVHRRSRDGKWVGTLEAGVTDKGKRRRVTVTGRSEAEVTRKLTRRRTEIEKAEGTATAPDATRKTVHAFGQEWIARRPDEVRPKTFESSRSALRLYIDPTVGRKRLIDLSVRDLRAVDHAVRTAGRGEPTVAKTRSVFIKMLRDALGDGYAVPSTIFDAPTGRQHATGNRPVRGALPTAHAIAVLGAAAQLPHGCRWLVGFYQGMRQGEVLGMTWDSVDLDAGTIRLEWQLQPLTYLDSKDKGRGFRVPRGFDARQLEGRFHLVRPKTAAGFREPPMTETVRQALLAWREAWPENRHGLLFARPNGWPVDKADDADEFRALQAAAGVKKGVDDAGEPVYFTGHEMRNTCATLLAEAGVDPVTIAGILGHSSFATSQLYIEARKQHMRAALANVEAAYIPKEIS